MKIVAIEEHFWYEPLSLKLEPADMFKKLKHPACDVLGDVAEGRLAAMDKAGIDFQLLSHFDPGVQELSTEEAIPLAREANDFLAEAVKKNPTRFGGFASLATQDPKAAVAELERCVKHYGFKGAIINGHTHGHYLDDPKYWPILEAAEALNVPIYLHPTTPPEAVLNTYFKDYLDEGLHMASWGFAVETGTHALRLIYSGVLDRFPNLQFVLGHMGELLPFALWRIDRYYLPKSQVLKNPPAGKGLKRLPSEYIKSQFHVTTSGFFSYPALLCTLLELGADRIMFAVDYPMDDNEAGVEWLKNCSISPDDLQKIAHKNAEKLFGI